jgi:hypothetical protein
MSKKSALKSWIEATGKRYIKTSDVLFWGANIGSSNRAYRDKQQLVQDGFLRKLTEPEAQEIVPGIGEGIYEVNKRVAGLYELGWAE